MLTESPTQQAWREFTELVCPSCGKNKRTKSAFCSRCYFRLPKDKQFALWKRFGDGFERAYEDAKEWLSLKAKGLTG